MKRLLFLLIFLISGAFTYPPTRAQIFNLAEGRVPGFKVPDFKVPTSIQNPFESGKKPEAGAPGIEVEFPMTRDFRENPRAWTFADGSQLEAVVLAADAKNAQIRVLKMQGVAQVKLDVFAENDRNLIRSWVDSEAVNGIAGLPIKLKNHDWPRQWRSRENTPLKQIGNTNQWKSQHFEIVNEAGINRASLESIVMICESVDGALRSLPLPLPVNWGRPSNEKRKIIIEQSNTGDQMMNVAGYWDGRTGIVHIFADYLIEPNHQLVVFEFDKPEKVQKYDVIVHEVTHQSTAALIYLGVPAWVPEGLAEYMSATQYAPAAYQFTNTHVTLKYHINKGLLGDRIVKDRRMNLVHLEQMMNRDILEWNHLIDSGDVAGGLQYNQALLLIDYFVHRDHPEGLHFRKYLEGVLSGIPEEEARKRHLLRGRSYQDLEREISKLWNPLGFTIAFQNRAELREGDVTIDWAAEDVKRTIASQKAIAEQSE